MNISLIYKQNLIRICLCGLFCVFAFLFSAQTLNAQTPPATSFGEGLLPITLNECVLRAEKAFTAEGFKIVNKNTSESLGYAIAIKGIHSAYIFCNAGPGEQMWFNVVVASSSGDSSVPKAERLKLETKMNASPPAADKPVVKSTPR